MAAKFVAEEGDIKGITLSLEGAEEWVVGSDAGVSTLVINEGSVSSKHMLCRSTPDGIAVENLSDDDPILVNGEEVDSPRLLKNSDTVKIGSNIFRYYAEDEAQVDEDMEPAERNEETEEHETIYEEVTDEDKGILAEIDFDIKETGRWLLKVIGGPNNGAEFSMQAGESYTIGTDPASADVVFHDTSVSRQHAKISVSNDDRLTISDMGSRNGTLIDGEAIEGEQPLDPSTLVTIGTTSFLVFDREGDMQTIISPLMPSIVRGLQKEEPVKVTESEDLETSMAEPVTAERTESRDEQKQKALGAFILTGIITGLFIVVGLGTITLFQGEQVIVGKQYDHNAELAKALEGFPDVRHSFNPNSGQLLLVGDVLTLTDRNQLMYNLQGLEFIKNIDSRGLIIDELVSRNTNDILNRNPRWKGINVHSPTAGRFVLSGYLKTRKEAEDLSDYITANFLYLDRLENKVIVDEDVINTVETQLENSGLKNMTVQMSNGELTFSGRLNNEQMVTFNRKKKEFSEINGVTKIKTFITETQGEASTVNISNRYQVGGVTRRGGQSVHVVLNGRIISKGDTIDGMTVMNINPTKIMLEKDGINYQIDYNQ